MDKRQLKRHQRLLTNSQKLKDVKEPLNRKQLCELLGENYKTRDITKQEKEWKDYFSFRKRGQSYFEFKVLSIQDIKQNQVQKLLSDSLLYTACLFFETLYKEYHQDHILISTLQLGQMFGLFNSTYYTYLPAYLNKEDQIQKALLLQKQIKKTPNKKHPNIPDIKYAIRKNESKKIHDKLSEILSLYESYQDAWTEDDVKETEFWYESINRRLDDDFLVSYLNNGLSDGDTPCPEVLNGLIQFYNYVPRNLRNRIEKALKDLHDGYIIKCVPVCVGFKNRQLVQLSNSEYKKYMVIIHEVMTEMFGEKYSATQVNKMMGLQNSVFKEKVDKKVQEELEYDKIFTANDILFEHNIISKFKEFYEEEFIKSFTAFNVFELVSKNSNTFREKEKNNFERRKENLSPSKVLDGKIGESTFNYLADTILSANKVDFECTTDFTNLPYIPDKWNTIMVRAKKTNEENVKNTLENQSPDDKIPVEEVYPFLSILTNSILGKALLQNITDDFLEDTITDLEF